MVDFRLTAEPFLGGYHQNIGNLSLSEITNRAIFSLALPLGQEDEAFQLIKSEFKIDVPDIGNAAKTKDELITILRLGIDQFFCLTDTVHDTKIAHAAFSSRVGDYFYTTDQSHAWVSLTLCGNDVDRVLERICPIDLHPSIFAVDCIARTAMENLATIIYRHSDSGFTLMSASSSAKSFLHTIEISINNAG